MLEEWNGDDIFEKTWRVRWKTTDNKKRSGWLPNDYPSYSATRPLIIAKDIHIEIENYETGERKTSEVFPVSRVLSMKYLRIVTPQGYADTAGLGLGLDDGSTYWVYHNGKYRHENDSIPLGE